MGSKPGPPPQVGTLHAEAIEAAIEKVNTADTEFMKFMRDRFQEAGAVWQVKVCFYDANDTLITDHKDAASASVVKCTGRDAIETGTPLWKFLKNPLSVRRSIRALSHKSHSVLYLMRAWNTVIQTNIAQKPAAALQLPPEIMESLKCLAVLTPEQRLEAHLLTATEFHAKYHVELKLPRLAEFLPCPRSIEVWNYVTPDGIRIQSPRPLHFTGPHGCGAGGEEGEEEEEEEKEEKEVGAGGASSKRKRGGGGVSARPAAARGL